MGKSFGMETAGRLQQSRFAERNPQLERRSKRTLKHEEKLRIHRNRSTRSKLPTNRILSDPLREDRGVSPTRCQQRSPNKSQPPPEQYKPTRTTRGIPADEGKRTPQRSPPTTLAEEEDRREHPQPAGTG